MSKHRLISIPSERELLSNWQWNCAKELRLLGDKTSYYKQTLRVIMMCHLVFTCSESGTQSSVIPLRFFCSPSRSASKSYLLWRTKFCNFQLWQKPALLLKKIKMQQCYFAIRALGCFLAVLHFPFVDWLQFEDKTWGSTGGRAQGLLSARGAGIGPQGYRVVHLSFA